MVRNLIAEQELQSAFRRLRQSALQLREKTGPRNYRPAAAVLESGREFGLFAQDADRYNHSADMEKGIVADAEMGEIGEMQRDTIAPSDPQTLQASGQTAHGLIEMAVIYFLAAENHGAVFWHSICNFLEMGDEGWQ